MPTPECLDASAKRVEHARNRLLWQRRLVAKTSDAVVKRVGERMITTLEEIVVTLAEAHELMLRRARRDAGSDDSN